MAHGSPGPGNFVSISQSLGDAFGSGITVPGTGVILNNAMKLFDPRPGPRPAGIQPYRRPMAPWPTLVVKDGHAVLALGKPLGHPDPQRHRPGATTRRSRRRTVSGYVRVPPGAIAEVLGCSTPERSRVTLMR